MVMSIVLFFVFAPWSRFENRAGGISVYSNRVATEPVACCLKMQCMVNLQF